MARSTRSVPQQQTHHQNTNNNTPPSTTTLHTISQLSNILTGPTPQHTPTHPYAMPATPPQPSFRCLTTRTRSWGRVVKHRPHPTPLPGGWPKTAQPSRIDHAGHRTPYDANMTHPATTFTTPARHPRMQLPPTPRVQSPHRTDERSVYAISTAAASTPSTRNASATSRASSSRGA